MRFSVWSQKSKNCWISKHQNTWKGISNSKVKCSHLTFISGSHQCIRSMHFFPCWENIFKKWGVSISSLLTLEFEMHCPLILSGINQIPTVNQKKEKNWGQIELNEKCQHVKSHIFVYIFINSQNCCHLSENCSVIESISQ